MAQPFFPVVVETHHAPAVLAVCQLPHARVSVFHLLQVVPVFQQVVYSVIFQMYVVPVEVLHFRYASYGIIVSCLHGSFRICHLCAASQSVIAVA